RHAGIEGDRGAFFYAEAGKIAHEDMKDAETAQRHFEKALSLDAEMLSALRGLAMVHEGRGNWTQSVEFALRAEGVSSSRGDRVELLWDAAQMVDLKLADPARALELYERILKLDPDHVDAGTRVADQLVSAK